MVLNLRQRFQRRIKGNANRVRSKDLLTNKRNVECSLKRNPSQLQTWTRITGLWSVTFSVQRDIYSCMKISLYITLVRFLDLFIKHRSSSGHISKKYSIVTRVINQPSRSVSGLSSFKVSKATTRLLSVGSLVNYTTESNIVRYVTCLPVNVCKDRWETTRSFWNTEYHILILNSKQWLTISSVSMYIKPKMKTRKHFLSLSLELIFGDSFKNESNTYFVRFTNYDWIAWRWVCELMTRWTSSLDPRRYGLV